MQTGPNRAQKTHQLLKTLQKEYIFNRPGVAGAVLQSPP